MNSDYEKLQVLIGNLILVMPFPIAFSLNPISKILEQIEIEVDYEMRNIDRADSAILKSLGREIANFTEILMRYVGFVAICVYEMQGCTNSTINRFVAGALTEPPGAGTWTNIYREIAKDLIKIEDIDQDSLAYNLAHFSFDANQERTKASLAFDNLITFRNDVSHAVQIPPECLQNSLNCFSSVLNGISFLQKYPLIGVKMTSASDNEETMHRIQRLMGNAAYGAANSKKFYYPYQLTKTHIYLLQKGELENAQCEAWIDLHPMLYYIMPLLILGEDDIEKEVNSPDVNKHFYFEFQKTIKSKDRNALGYLKVTEDGKSITTTRREIVQSFWEFFNNYSCNIVDAELDWIEAGKFSENRVTEFCKQVDFNRKWCVPRPEIDTQLDQFVASDQPSLCVLTGESGKGKTYALASLGKRLRKNDHLVLAIHCGQQLTAEPQGLREFLLQRLLGDSPGINWTTLTKVAKKQGKKVVILLDSLEDYQWSTFSSMELARKLAVEIQRQHIKVKFVISCGEAYWPTHEIALKTVHSQVVRVGFFTEGEAQDALNRYGRGDLALIPEVVRLVRDPLFLRLLSELPETSSFPEIQSIDIMLFESYYIRSVNSEQRQGLILDCLIELLLQADLRLVNLEILIQRLVDHNLPEDGWLALINKGILGRVRKSSTDKIIFRHSRFMEYCVVRYFISKYGETEFTATDLLNVFFHQNHSSRFGFSYASAILAKRLEKGWDERVLLELSRSGRPEGIRLFVHACSDMVKHNPADVNKVIMRSLKTHNDHYAKIAALDAIRAVGGQSYKAMLDVIPREKDSAILLLAAHVFYLYTVENIDDAFISLTDALGSKVKFYRSPTSTLRFMLNLTHCILSMQYNNSEVLLKLGRFWKRVLPNKKLITLVFPVARLVFRKRLETRFGVEFQQDLDYRDDIFWFLGNLRNDPTGRSLDIDKMKKIYLKLLRAPHEIERIIGRLAGMLMFKWHPKITLKIVMELLDRDVTGKVCKEVVILLGAAAMWSHKHAEDLKKPIDKWTERIAENYSEFWNINTLQDAQNEQLKEMLHQNYPFAQAGYLRLELGISIHDIYLDLSSEFSEDPILLSFILQEMAAVGLNAPETISQTLVEMSEFIDLKEPIIKASLAKVFAILGVEHMRLVPAYLRQIEDRTKVLGIIEEYEILVHSPETITEHSRMRIDLTGRSIWGILVNQPVMWAVLVEFFDELVHAKSVQEYIKGFAIHRLFQLIDQL